MRIYFGRSRRNTSGRSGETETTAMVWSPPADASPPATVTDAKMPATWQEEEAWRNLTLLDRRCQ